MKFRYTAYNRNGEPVSAVTDAADSHEAIELLRRDGLYVIEIAEIGDRSSRPRTQTRHRIGTGQRLKCLATFARQLHVLVASGTQLVPALAALERQVTGEKWQQVLRDVREQVEEGTPLSEAMSDWPEYFDAISRSLVAAGEASGNMAEMLQRLSILVRKQLHLRNSIIGAMIYPCLLITAGIGVLMVMLFFVLPRFVVLFETLDVPLPPTTRALIALSGLLQSYWWIVLIALLVGGISLKLLLASEQGRQFMHRAILRLPKLGSVAKSLILARISRLLGVLIEGHVPLLDALQLTKQAAGNICYAQLIKRAEDAVSHGEPVSSAFADEGLVTPSVYEAIRNGEQSGRIGDLLLHMADVMDEDNEVVVRSLTSILEPIILIGLGCIVAFIAISMFLPLFDLAAMAQGGH